MKLRNFEKVFKTAEIAKFNREETMDYQTSLKLYRDLKNSIETARLEGIEEGKKLRLEKLRQIEIEKGKKLGLEEGKKIGIEEGEKLGLEEGKKIGIEEIARKIAKNLKDMAIDNEIIAKGTGLNIEEIEKL